MKTHLIVPAIVLGVASFALSTNALADSWSQETNRWVVQPTKTWVVDPVTNLTRASVNTTNQFVSGTWNATTGWMRHGPQTTMHKTGYHMHHHMHHNMHHHHHHNNQ